jgi:glucose/arabinose dehydrogenase
VASPDGARLYVGIGSNSNAGEGSIDLENGRAQIVEIDPATGQSRSFATGLRNPVGMAFEPNTGVLWVVVNERDELGSDLVPDYLTEVKDGAFYGWPFSYWGQHVDQRAKPANPELVAKALKPDYALGNHVAPLGLAFATGDFLSDAYRSGAFIGEHGSWNRIPFSGYKVVFVAFEDGRPQGSRSTCSLASSANGVRRKAGLPASPSTARARCWSPMMSATWCGASRPPAL